MKTKIKNPILTGFNPDPCILRVGDDYYLAVSTFEYYPGVQIYTSKDLVNWKVVARPITSDKADLTAMPQGGGVWAPCLSHDGNKFYLVYSRVTIWSSGPFKDVDNFIITADRVDGKWSKPVYINSHGFDASLFHDDDGKKYYMCMEWDPRHSPDNKRFTGILLWEMDQETFALKGEPKKIFCGTDRGSVEGPHIYKRNGWYYLFTAEGGTNVEHAETVARSRNIFGPYEVHPYKHIITSYQTNNPLQKAGHASIVDDGKGNWYLAHLCGRKLMNGNCVLGRETSLQNIEFRDDDWCYLKDGGTQPYSYYEVEGKVNHNTFRKKKLQFTRNNMKNMFQSLRTPLGKRARIIDKDTIELVGAEGICSLHCQTLLAYRQQHIDFRASVKLDFHPENFNHTAGLIYRYNEENQYFLFMTHDENKGNVLRIQSIVKGEHKWWDEIVTVKDSVYLAIDVKCEKGQFYYSEDGSDYVLIGKPFDTSVLSDESACPMGFTGAFIGLYAGDGNFRKKTAKFSFFEYENKEEKR